MAFDYKKEYKEFYLPKDKPDIVTIPAMNFVAVRGKGDPNEDKGEYMKDYAGQNGCSIDITTERYHHEIYLSDPRKTAPEKLKTVIRYPIRQI